MQYLPEKKMTLTSIARAILLICFVALPMSVHSAEPISLGLESHIWYFMWAGGKSLKETPTVTAPDKIKWNVIESTLDKYAELGAQWNLVLIYQAIDGPDGFARAKRLVDEHQKRGIKVVFRLIEAPSVYDNLDDKESSAYGFNKTYYQWIKSVAETFQTQVQYFLISNEVDHDIGFNQAKYEKAKSVTYDQYRKVLDTAYMAIKGVNPKLMVVDHGLSAFSLGLAIMEDMVSSGHSDEAYEFWKEYQYGREKDYGSKMSMKWLLSRDDVKLRVQVVRKTLMNPGKSDLIQIHYYASWRALPKTLDWLTAKMQEGRSVRPMFAAEVGYRFPTKPGTSWDGRKMDVADFSRYSEEEHAISMVKDFAILFGAGVSHAEWWHSRFHHARDNNATLYKGTEIASEFVPYKAANAYRMMATTLNGFMRNPKRMIPSTDISEFRFSGPKDVSVVWSDKEVVLKTKDMPPIQEIQGIYGGQQAINPNGALTFGPEPVYIFWAAASATGASKVQR